MVIPISDKVHQSGFLSWDAIHEKDIHILLRGLDSVHLFFQGADLGSKKINRKTRKIHMGPQDPVAPEFKSYKLVRRGDSLLVTLI